MLRLIFTFSTWFALFTRGETQAIVTATLGSGRDIQTVDALAGEIKDNFMLHYNFPSYSVGELGFPMGPKEGKLAMEHLQRDHYNLLFQV